MHTQLIFYKYILTDSSSGKNSLDILAPKRASARSSNFAIDFGPDGRATRNFISILRVPKVKNVPKNRFGKFQRPSKWSSYSARRKRPLKHPVWRREMRFFGFLAAQQEGRISVFFITTLFTQKYTKITGFEQERDNFFFYGRKASTKSRIMKCGWWMGRVGGFTAPKVE